MSKPPRQSLARRATLLVLAVAACGVLMTLLLAQRLVGDRLEQEAMAIESLAERRASERVVAEIGHASHRIDMLGSALEDGLVIFSGDAEFRGAVAAGDGVRVSRHLSEDLPRFGFRAGFVTDHRLLALASHKMSNDLSTLRPILEETPFADLFRDLLDSAASGGREAYHRLVPMDQKLRLFFGLEGVEAAFLVAVALRDHDRDVSGLVVAVRPLRKEEPVLRDFAHASGVSLGLYRDERLLSGVGPVTHELPALAAIQKGLVRLDSAGRIGRCSALPEGFTLCLERPLAEITAFRDEMAAIGVAQSRRTSMLLTLAGVLGLFVLALVAKHVVRWFTRPLIELTGTVDAISRGRFEVSVPFATREDEIGQIARAVASMRGRLEERDRLRSEMARIDAINQRRVHLAGALQGFEQRVGTVMSGLTTTLESLGPMRLNLDQAAHEAQAQAERIRISSQETMSSTQAVNGATLSLSEGIHEISTRMRVAKSAVQHGVSQLEEVETGLDQAAIHARQAGEGITDFHGLVSELARGLLAATQQAGGHGRSGEAALAYNDFAERAGDIAARLNHDIACLQSLMLTSGDALDATRSDLGQADQEAGEIVIVVAEQGAATRSIADGLAGAAEAMSGLAEAVEGLQRSLGGTHAVGETLVDLAHRIIEDAREIDASVRSFVQDAAA